MGGLELTARQSRRLIVYRPLAGINDALCQLELCWSYADRFGRRLVVDPPGDTVVGHFFSLVEPRVNREGAPLWLHPRLGEESSQEAQRLLIALGGLSESDAERVRSLPPSPVDFQVDSPDSILVHEQAGGGTASFDAIKRLRIRSGEAEKVAQLLPSLPAVYDALHIRSTDYASDVAEIVGRLPSGATAVPLLICSDSDSAVMTARQLVANREVIAFSPHEARGEAPLHLPGAFQTNSERIVAARRLVAEMVAMAGARRFYYGFTLANNAGEPRHLSGFSTLVRYLVSHRRVARGFFGQSLLPRGAANGRAVLLGSHWEKTHYRAWRAGEKVLWLPQAVLRRSTQALKSLMKF